jgi:predicted acyl esterase
MVGFLETWLKGNVIAVQGREPVVDLLERVKEHPFDEPEHYGPDGDVLYVPDLSKINVPFLTSVCLGAPVHGRGGAEAFVSAKNAPSKELIIVDANYWPFMYQECLAQEFAFFDRHLKGDDTVPSFPPVRAIMRTGNGKYEWHQDMQWPLSEMQVHDSYLDGSIKGSTGSLSTKPHRESATSVYSAEAPSDQSENGPCAIFVSQPLAEDIEIAGPISAFLWVSASAFNMDVYAVLRVLDQYGKEVSYAAMPLMEGCPLSHGCLKVSHRASDLERSIPWRPFHTHRQKDYAPLVPDEIVSVHVEMTLATARVPRGYRIQLLLEPFSGASSSTWKAYGGIASPGSQAEDQNRSVGGRACDASYHKGVENCIHTGPTHLSKLIIPSIQR